MNYAYVLAFGPSRHRAWVVVQRPLGCSLGSREKPLGGLLEAVLRHRGAVLGSLGASFTPPGGRSGASWEAFGGLFGHLGGLLGPPVGLLGRKAWIFGLRSPLLGFLRAVLGRY